MDKFTILENKIFKENFGAIPQFAGSFEGEEAEDIKVNLRKIAKQKLDELLPMDPRARDASVERKIYESIRAICSQIANQYLDAMQKDLNPTEIRIASQLWNKQKRELVGTQSRIMSSFDEALTRIEMLLEHATAPKNSCIHPDGRIQVQRRSKQRTVHILHGNVDGFDILALQNNQYDLDLRGDGDLIAVLRKDGRLIIQNPADLSLLGQGLFRPRIPNQHPQGSQLRSA